ncbi:hypothetical protein LXA43DRAFT_1115229 [Ganoderma leucocontextum]|nr:hypothetical protein LXA43DRAFT_1115229 [Ganoderma leucocontextum]
MGQFTDEIPDNLLAWIRKQEMFFVATAPLSGDGHVSLSPQRLKTRVWYEDLSGSSVETISHLKENKRITIMFCAFDGAARIVRLFGTGPKVYEVRTPEYAALIPPDWLRPSSQSSSPRLAFSDPSLGAAQSCGYAVPLYAFKAHRTCSLQIRQY